MEKDLVSIITPCYNGETYLDRYFKSILNQTYDKLELIFVNDGSTDGTEQLVEKYRPFLEEKGIKFIYLEQENKGQAAALNYGLQFFTGEYLTWPDSDDEMLPNCIQTKVDYMKRNQNCNLCICKIAKVLENDPDNILEIMERKRPKPETLFEDLLFLNNVFYAPGGYMARSQVIDEVIPQRHIYTGQGGQNAQLLIPVAAKGNIGYIDEVLYKYYVRDDSHSHSVKSSIQIIRQLEYFETIIVETLRRTDIVNKSDYIEKVQKHYSRLIYGNAIDSQNKKEIKTSYKKLKKVSDLTIKEKLLYFKYGILS